ncbi:hypothetical protein H6P81_006081 [Aristolochia fimbriata]|uniref:Uncharacterized protein n=1 Tax=Aristolochia fimbriata TaxID=158543 RepID=A0AAV7EZV5_ARIFI|nr:hypothetical protein H6P81_006081 [Aristolochia fimbriata]
MLSSFCGKTADGCSGPQEFFAVGGFLAVASMEFCKRRLAGGGAARHPFRLLSSGSDEVSELRLRALESVSCHVRDARQVQAVRACVDGREDALRRRGRGAGDEQPLCLGRHARPA